MPLTAGAEAQISAVVNWIDVKKDKPVGNNQNVDVSDHAEGSMENVGDPARVTLVHFRGEDIHTGPRRGSWNTNEGAYEAESHKEDKGKCDSDVNGVLHSSAMRADCEASVEQENRNFVQTSREVEHDHTRPGNLGRTSVSMATKVSLLQTHKSIPYPTLDGKIPDMKIKARTYDSCFKVVLHACSHDPDLLAPTTRHAVRTRAMSSDPRTVIIVIVVLFLLLVPESPPSSLVGGGDHRLDQAVAREWAALDLLNRSHHGQFDPPHNRWLNLSGLKEEDGFAWDALDGVKARAKEQADHILGREQVDKALSGDATAHLPIYHNVTGHIRGSWVRSHIESKVKPPQLNLTTFFPPDARTVHSFERNITGLGGHFRFEFDSAGEEKSYNGIRVLDMKATAVIADQTSAGDGWSVVLYGHHFVDAGHIILTTSSAKFAGIFALPHFGISGNLFKAGQEALQPRLQRIIKLQSSRELEAINPYSSSIDGSSDNAYSPHCDLIVYLQQHPLQVMQKNGAPVSAAPSTVADIEKELRFPEGRYNLAPPPLKMSALIFSPDCGFVIESKGPPDYPPSEDNHLVGEKQEVYVRTGIIYTLLFGVILAGQLYLTVSQMKESSTPSTRSRVSTYTIALLSLGDGFAGMAFLPLGMLLDSASPALFSTAFMAFLGVCFFDMRFLLDIWTIQVQERRRQERQQAPTSSSVDTLATSTLQQVTTAAPAPIITAAGVDSLPLPISSRAALASGASAISLPFDQDGEADGTNPAATTTQPTEANDTRRELGSLYA
ncbi:hypothetical protein FKW77_001466 [Venturia effusa]|uniref:RING-type E3 ubiquitin transferase n=1 Tax=Venturia effusa TaxID=50376 RepID=A0A517LJN2_9PEZI|nr:hypothetical protein FKW77_001466 [Venturia effusa]